MMVSIGLRSALGTVTVTALSVCLTSVLPPPRTEALTTFRFIGPMTMDSDSSGHFSTCR